MKTIIMLIKRKPGLTLQEFKDYYESRHASLALKLAPQIAECTRNRATTSCRANRIGRLILADVNKDVDAAFDVVTDITFRTEADDQKMVNTLADPKMGKLLADDEEKFVDRSAIVMYFVEERRTPRELLYKDW